MYSALLMNSQSVLAVWGIQGSPFSSFMVVMAQVTMGLVEEDEVIFSARAMLMAWI